MKNAIISEFLKWLGLNEKEILIYQALNQHGELSILQLSRILQLPRTNVYRKIENMKAQGIVDEVVDEYSTRIRAANWEEIEFLYNQKRREYEQYKKLLPQIKNTIIDLTQTADKFTKVLYYRGKEGIARMSWQALYTKDEFRGYTFRQYAEILEKKETERFRDRWKETGKFGREIYSDEQLESVKENPDLDTGHWENWETRYISPKILTINHQLDIYNDIVAIYRWHDNEIFGVQIINEKVANFQKQLFDLAWKQTQKIKKI